MTNIRLTYSAIKRPQRAFDPTYRGVTTYPNDFDAKAMIAHIARLQKGVCLPSQPACEYCKTGLRNSVTGKCAGCGAPAP